MPVTPEENAKYGKFVNDVAIDLGVFDFGNDKVVWHYTNGDGLLGILQSSTLHATQVASLNDSNETTYATELFVDSVTQVISERSGDPQAVAFLNEVLEFVKEDNRHSTHGTSKFFVVCFSEDEDELTQWDRYGRPNGYAIGFKAGGLFREPNSRLYRVVYDREKQLQGAKKIAEATLDFYLEGLNDERMKDPELWGKEFFTAWDEWVYKLAPLAKDKKWRSENEYRIVHELKVAEFPNVRFKQRQTMLARYIPLDTPYWIKRRSQLLPIAKIWIGPGGNQEFTRVSINLLLEQMGYTGVPVELSVCTLTRP
jgi:hypothetical protein